MADRYWVGGTGTWNTTSTTNWSTASGGSSGASAPTASDTVIFDNNSNTGTGAFTVTVSAGLCLDMTFGTGASALDGAMTLAMGTSTLTVSGNWTNPATNFAYSGTGTITFNATTSKTITTNGIAMVSGVTFDGVGGTWALQDALTAVGTVTLANGTINLNDKNLTCGVFNSSTTSTRTIAFGAGQIYVTQTAQAVVTMGTITGLTVTGTPVFNATGAGTSGQTRTVNYGTAGGGTEANSSSFNVTAGADTFTFGTGCMVKDLNFTGFSGTLTNNTKSIYGNLTISSGMTLTAGGLIQTFRATSGTKTITTNGKTLDFPITFDGVGGTWALQDALTVGSTRTVTLTNGALVLNNYTFTCGIFSSSSSNTRSIAFGTTGQMTITGSATTVWSMATSTGFTTTGTTKIVLTSVATTGTRNVRHGSLFGVAAGIVNFYVTGGTDTINLFGIVNGIDLTGFTGAYQVAGQTQIYGNVNLFGATSATATSASAQFVFRGSANQTFKSPGNLMTGVSVWLNKSLGTETITLQNDFLTDQQILIYVGQFNAVTYNVQANNIYVGAGNDTRGINMGSGTWTLTPISSGSAWIHGLGGVYTFTAGTANIVINGSPFADIGFSGGGYSYNKLTFQNGMSLNINNSTNSFTELASTATTSWVLRLQASTTTTVGSWTINGSAGNLVYLRSTTPGTQATVSQATGTVTGQYLNIQDSAATGGATWIANPAINGGNNTGWTFPGTAIASRLTSTGVLYANGQFDEVTQTTISTSYLALYSAQFDEVTLNGQPSPQRRELSTGIVQVNGYFDETGGPLT